MGNLGPSYLWLAPECDGTVSWNWALNLWDLTPSQGRQRQSWVKLQDIQLVLQSCLVRGKPKHLLTVSARSKVLSVNVVILRKWWRTELFFFTYALTQDSMYARSLLMWTDTYSISSKVSQRITSRKKQRYKIWISRKKRSNVFSFPSRVRPLLNYPWFCSYVNNHIFRQYLKKKACLVLRDLFRSYGWQERSDFFWIYLCCRVGKKGELFHQS